MWVECKLLQTNSFEKLNYKSLTINQSIVFNITVLKLSLVPFVLTPPLRK